MPVPTGAHASLHYQYETAYKDGGDGTNHIFGANQSLDTNEATNNGTRIYLPGSNRAVDIKEGTFDGGWAVSFDLTNPWWLGILLGQPSTTDNGDGTYTHTYDGDATSITILDAESKNDEERPLLGCVPASASIDPTTDDNTVPCTIEGFYATEGTLGTHTTQTQLSFDAYDYADATLSLGGASESIVQNASLSFTSNTEPIPEFGTRFAVDYLIGAFEPEISYGKIKSDSASVQDVYGGSTSPQENITNTQGVTLDFAKGSDTIAFNCATTFPESYNAPKGDPSAAIEEDLNRYITDVTVDATNSTANAP